MLSAAGVDFEVRSADVDEVRLRDAHLLERPAASAVEIATLLAEAKAVAVSRSDPDAWVIGADQVLAIGPRQVAKAADRAGARETLRALRNARHELHSAVALVLNGKVIWSHVDSAALTMRDFSDQFLDRYLDEAGNAILGSVGCYHLEGLGAQLFETIDGDYFTILGMPLLPLLAELRVHGLLAT
jgi:septum formation protein